MGPNGAGSSIALFLRPPEYVETESGPGPRPPDAQKIIRVPQKVRCSKPLILLQRDWVTRMKVQMSKSHQGGPICTITGPRSPKRSLQQPAQFATARLADQNENDGITGSHDFHF